MKRAAIYSGSRPARRDEAGPSRRGSAAIPQPEPDVTRPARSRVMTKRRVALLGFAGGAIVVMAAAGVYFGSRPAPRVLTQEDIDAAVLHTLENKALPSRTAKAAAIVAPSVVRVRGFGEPPRGKAKHKPGESERRQPDGSDKGKDDPESAELSIGSGVVVVDNGIILTNLHVVFGAQRVTVTFHDGSESEAELVSVHPENDLAVIKARTIPDDLPAATLGSADQLKPGDEVVAVGFPMGIGPSVSGGVVSGLNREFRSPKGDRVLTQLIQFDAAVNPGSSGGPLVTMQGDVVGIVTAILSPNRSRTFIGIGFAVTIGAAGSAVGMHPF
jgi:S1-C subfamily serine protease